MTVTRVIMFTTVLYGVTCCGCERLNVSLNYQEPRTVVYSHVDVAHVCTDGCVDHYYNGSEVVVLRGHRHGYRCGHHWDGRHWVVLETPRQHRDVNIAPYEAVTTTHHHGPACGCVYDRAGSKWLKVSDGHIHGAGCGHVLQHGRWSVIVKSSHQNKRLKIRPRKVKRRH